MKKMNDKDDKWAVSSKLHKGRTALARKMRKQPTRSENLLWQALRRKGLDGRKFRRQVPIGTFVVDFYCPSERLVVEVDGPIHDFQKDLDHNRQQALESLGLTIVRVKSDLVENDLTAALEQIRASVK